VIKVECVTKFDITCTGVVGHYKSSRVPFEDRAGHKIIDQESWDRSRNQQRNWETLTQLISLRTQVFDISDPMEEKSFWRFEFSTETPDAFGTADDPVRILREDSNLVPMLRELDNDPDVEPMLITYGPKQNIWFRIISINN
jgi:hypothetical protein